MPTSCTDAWWSGWARYYECGYCHWQIRKASFPSSDSGTQKIRSYSPSRVKPVAYKIDTCCYLAWHSVLIGQGLVSSVSEWFECVGYQVMKLVFPVGQHCRSRHECALSQVGAHNDMSLDVARTNKRLLRKRTLQSSTPLNGGNLLYGQEVSI